MYCKDNAIKCILLANFRANLVHFIYHQFCTFHRSPKILTCLAEQIRTFYPSLHESITLPLSLYDQIYTNRRVTTQVNTIQHESNTSHHDCNTSLTRINTSPSQFNKSSTGVNTRLTRISRY